MRKRVLVAAIVLVVLGLAAAYALLPTERQAYAAAIITAPDVETVNLWDTPTDRTRVLGTVRNGETVGIVERSGAYVHIQTRTGVQGWVLRDFIRSP